MKKKFLSLALAAVMAVGATFAFAGCDSKNDKDSDNGGNGDGQLQITDKTQQELLNNMATMPLEYAHLNARLNLDSSGEASSSLRGLNATIDMYAHLVESDITADLTMMVSSAKTATSEGGSSYVLAFMREDYTYMGSGTWETAKVTPGNWDNLYAELKNTESGVSLIRQSSSGTALPGGAPGEGAPGAAMGGQVAAIAEMIPIDLVKSLLANIPALVGGAEVKAADGGYTVTYDLVAALQTLANNLGVLAENVTADTTVNELLNKDLIKNLFTTLFNGITAKQILDLDVLEMAPQIKELLPAAAEGQSVYDYVKGLASNKDFYANTLGATLEGDSDSPVKATTFGELTVYELAYTVDNGVEKGDVTRYVDMVKGYLAKVKDNLINGLCQIVSEQSGDTASANLGAKITLNFGADKKFKSMEYNIDPFAFSTTGTDSFSVDMTCVYKLEALDSYTFKDLKGMKYMDVATQSSGVIA